MMPQLPSKVYLSEFQDSCQRTRNPNLTQEKYLLNAVMGLAGEAAETLEIVFRHAGNLNDTMVREIVLLEIGDIMWYAADLCTTLGYRLGQVTTIDLDHVSEPWRARTPDSVTFATQLMIVTGKSLEATKKHVFHGKPLNEDTLKMVLSRVLLYATLLASTLELQLEHVCSRNVEKLKTRYPEGFSAAVGSLLAASEK